MERPELLAPAGNLEKLKMAIRFGADAVYLAGKTFGLRAGADNFTLEEMEQAVNFAHTRGARVYVAVNIFAHNRDLKGLSSYLKELKELKVDAIIVSDPGVFLTARKTVPDLSVHISTQANTTNWASVKFWQEMGARRMVLARELSLSEIAEIRKKTGAELEVFVHGAMCISYSGRCLLSSFLTGRGANLGDCAHPCRWQYHLVEEKRPNEFFPVLEDDQGTYFFNSKDLCLIQYLPELIQAGVASFKIEGRMKSAYYVATVVRTYREAIDAYFADSAHFTFRQEWLEELAKVSNREYTTGFLTGSPGSSDHRYQTSAYTRTADFIGVVQEYHPADKEAVIEQRNRFRTGEEVEFVLPRGPVISWRIPEMKNEAGELIEAAPHPRQFVTMPVPEPLVTDTLVRRSRDKGDDCNGG